MQRAENWRIEGEEELVIIYDLLVHAIVSFTCKPDMEGKTHGNDGDDDEHANAKIFHISPSLSRFLLLFIPQFR